MRRPPSLTLRLTLFFGIAAVVVFSGFGWFIERSIERHFHMEDAAELAAISRIVSETLSNLNTVDTPTTALEQRFNDILVGHHSAILHVARTDGRTVFVSEGGNKLAQFVSAESRKNQDNSVYRWQDSHHTYSVVKQHLSNDVNDKDSYTITIAVSIDRHLQFINNFRRTLWLMIISGIVVMGFMGWLAVRQGHAPLHNIVARIRNISASELNTRLSPETVPKELNDLAISFNEMLERMETSFLQLSNFSADIAHELRTPVTSLLTQTQVALSQSRNIDEYREILYSNIEQYEHMAQMISDMLFLAKTDNGQYPLNSADIDLSHEVKSLFEYYEAWAEERGVSLLLDGHAELSGDKLMIRRAVGNLLSNAIQHTPSGNTVTVHLQQTSEGKILIKVENPGSVISTEHLPKLFDRFYRTDTSRKRSKEGVGLGLAIVKSIIEIHGGTIDVSSTEESTQFKITLPLNTES